MPELWATGQSTFSLLAPTPASFLSTLQEGLTVRGAAQRLPKHQYSWSSGQVAPLAMGASAMIQGSPGALEMLGRIVLRLNQKRFLN